LVATTTSSATNLTTLGVEVILNGTITQTGTNETSGKENETTTKPTNSTKPPTDISKEVNTTVTETGSNETSAAGNETTTKQTKQPKAPKATEPPQKKETEELETPPRTRGNL